jgi:rRNA maturation endonuclease Nob1
MIDLLLLERLASRRTQSARYLCHACGREFEGWGPRETIRCPDCLTPVVADTDSAAGEPTD